LCLEKDSPSNSEASILKVSVVSLLLPSLRSLPAEATQLALRLCQNAPLDADAHALRIMLLLSSASRKHTSAPKDSPIGVTTEVAHRCCTILQLAHGASEEAVALLVDPLAEIGGAAPDEAYVAALCKFLDVAPSPLSVPDSLSSKGERR
jgi:hypothetical protein